jgi:hypothetical protein
MKSELTANTLVPSPSGITFLHRSCMCGSLSGDFAVSSKVLLWSVKELSSRAEVCLQNGQWKQFMKWCMCCMVQQFPLHFAHLHTVWFHILPHIPHVMKTSYDFNTFLVFTNAMWVGRYVYLAQIMSLRYMDLVRLIQVLCPSKKVQYFRGNLHSTLTMPLVKWILSVAIFCGILNMYERINCVITVVIRLYS